MTKKTATKKKKVTASSKKKVDTVKERVSLGVTMQPELEGEKSFEFIRADVSLEKDISDTDEASVELAKSVYKRLETVVKAMVAKYQDLKDQAFEDLAEE